MKFVNHRKKSRNLLVDRRKMSRNFLVECKEKKNLNFASMSQKETLKFTISKEKNHEICKSVTGKDPQNPSIGHGKILRKLSIGCKKIL